MINNINWYPGHMKKTRELIQENLKAVDLVVEIVDSRIPLSSRNPIIDELISGKKRVVILGKCDLADKRVTDEWKAYFESSGDIALPVDSRNGENIKAFYKILDKLQQERNKERSLRRPLRMMIVGVPNVGKSSFINRLIGKKSAKTGDRPGVTKGKQWVTLENGMQLLDTPGITWPKFEREIVGLNLALIGSINDEILPIEELIFYLLKYLTRYYGSALVSRYGETLLGKEEALEAMDAIAIKRACIKKGGDIDYTKVSRLILDDFRSGRLGRISLEHPMKWEEDSQMEV